MPVPTVARPKSNVKLSDDTQAQVRNETLLIQHRNTLIAAMDLTDAEYCGIDLASAAGDVAEMDTEFAPIFA